MRRRVRTVEHRLAESVLRLAGRTSDGPGSAWVDGCYGYEESAWTPVVRREFAGTRVVVILEIGAPLEVGEGKRAVRNVGGFVAGLQHGPTRTAHGGRQAGVQLNLKPLGARLVLGVPAGELTHRVVAATDVLPRSQRGLPSRLAELASWDERLDAVDAVIARAADERQPAAFRELAWAIAQIERRTGGVRIGALARELGWSERRLERSFAEHVGVSPKLFARLVRFEALMAAVRRGEHASWADAAPALGFADQSHLVRDVRQFAGVPPTAAEAQLLAVGSPA